MAVAQKVYKAKRGSRFTNADAEVIGAFLDAKFDGDPFDAEDVVKAARAKTSPLHPYFDWSDMEAAKEWRLQQARWLVAAITYEVITVGDDDEEAKPTRAYHHVVVTEEDAKGDEKRRPVYMQAEVVWSRPDLASQVIHQAGRELRSWGERYRQYADLAGAVNAVDVHVLPLIDSLLDEEDVA
jgi:hypothetical protein